MQTPCQQESRRGIAQLRRAVRSNFSCSHHHGRQQRRRAGVRFNRCSQDDDGAGWSPTGWTVPGKLRSAIRADCNSLILGHTAAPRGASHRPDERDANEAAQYLRDDVEGGALDRDLVRNQKGQRDCRVEVSATAPRGYYNHVCALPRAVTTGLVLLPFWSHTANADSLSKAASAGGERRAAERGRRARGRSAGRAAHWGARATR